MVFKIISQTYGNGAHESVQGLVMKLNDVTCLQIDQMIVLPLVSFLVQSPSVAKIMTADETQFFQQFRRSIYSWLIM